ncbi:MAG: hypothetical protein ACE5HX_07860, partial [bacterium]
RVKNDLEFIHAYARPDSVIPHAYYWKDSTYVTEFAGPDNWNHFWFILAASSYLKHSGDRQTLETLFPLLCKSITEIQKNITDHLMWAAHPDWWDIGNNKGPRSYMTILAIRALREFTHIATFLEQNIRKLSYYEKLAAKMQNRLTEVLWDPEMNYLSNYNRDGVKDKHYYIGSLLAAHFDLLPADKLETLIHTTETKLLDHNLGVYNAGPMDFHLLRKNYKFHGNEAGAPFVYFNGGIWPQGNAWFALSLIAAGENDAAFQFIKNTMSLWGVMNSPNGQPAMYEYRNSNYTDSTIYGKIDKPQFLWAAGWYLYCVYQLLGVRENEWNVTLQPYLIDVSHPTNFDFFVGGEKVQVSVSGSGKYIKHIKFNGKKYSSAVLPASIAQNTSMDIELGEPESPYVVKTNSVLNAVHFDEDEKELNVHLQAFTNHLNQTRIVTPFKPEKILLNGKTLKVKPDIKNDDGIYLINIHFSHIFNTDTLTVDF